MLSNDEIENILGQAIDDAVDFVESEISDERIKAQRYYDGLVDIGEEEGRSSVVETKVRDTIRAIKPSLLRVFLSTDKPVEFIPRKPQDALIADQATQYASYKFNQCNGYKVLSDVIHDTLLKKIGVAKVYYEEKEDVDTYEYTNLNDNEFALLVNDENVEIVEHSQEQTIEVTEMGEMITSTHDAKIAVRKVSGDVKIESVPPEEFFVDRNATSLDDAYIVCHRSEMRVSDLVSMGFDFDEVSELGGLSESETTTEEERYYRNDYYTDRDEESTQDPAMKMVLVTESYMKMDIDETGVARLYKFITGGNSHKLLDYEAVDDTPFCIFESDPQPHTFYGQSIADLLINEQDSTTSVIRGILDNVALTNNPQRTIVEELVNVDDVLNNEIGAIIRTKQPGAIQDLQVPFVAGSVLPFLQYLDTKSEQKTGVSKMTMGLDTDVLQNATATAVAAQSQASQGHIEVIARNIAEGGFKRLFKLILKEMMHNATDEEFIRINGQFVPMDIRSWNSDMDLMVNVGLGTGQDQEKLVALQTTLQQQQMVYQTYGPQNGIVSITNMRNTIGDMLALMGVRNSERYFAPMTPEQEQQLLAQQQQQQQQMQQQAQPDPAAMMMAEAEMAKAQADMQANQLKQQQIQVEMMKLQADQSAKQDKLESETALNIAKVEQGNIQLQQQQQKIDHDRDQKVAEMALKLTELEEKLEKDLNAEMADNVLVFDPVTGEFNASNQEQPYREGVSVP